MLHDIIIRKQAIYTGNWKLGFSSSHYRNDCHECRLEKYNGEEF